MGISVQQTVKAARAIGGAGIAMFGAVTTADSLDGTTSPYLAQVVPGVSNEVQALSRYLRKPSRAVLIYDEQATDLYTERLRADFTGTYGASIGEDEIPYAPSNSDSNLFKKIAEDVCYTPQQPPLVFYAGRELRPRSACHPASGGRRLRWPEADYRHRRGRRRLAGELDAQRRGWCPGLDHLRRHRERGGDHARIPRRLPGVARQG